MKKFFTGLLFCASLFCLHSLCCVIDQDRGLAEKNFDQKCGKKPLGVPSMSNSNTASYEESLHAAAQVEAIARSRKEKILPREEKNKTKRFFTCPFM